MSDGVDSEECVAEAEVPQDDVDVVETSNSRQEEEIDFEAEQIEDAENVSLDSTVAYAESEFAVEEMQDVEEEEGDVLSVAEEQRDVDEENEADSESSETESSTSSPPLRKSRRGRVPKSVFTYNDFGNPTITMM